MLALLRALLIDETTIGGFVRDGPTEIDLGFDDLSIVNSEDFGVAKVLPAHVSSDVSDKSIALGTKLINPNPAIL
jgi:hypothetical protein